MTHNIYTCHLCLQSLFHIVISYLIIVHVYTKEQKQNPQRCITNIHQYNTNIMKYYFTHCHSFIKLYIYIYNHHHIHRGNPVAWVHCIMLTDSYQHSFSIASLEFRWCITFNTAELLIKKKKKNPAYSIILLMWLIINETFSTTEYLLHVYSYPYL